MTNPVVRIEHVHKRFAGVYALQDVSLAIMPGEIHCLAGENGSGKSTLIKVIVGVHQSDEGTLSLNGNTYTHIAPIDAIREGVQVIYQDFALFPNLTVAENLSISSQLEKRRHLVRWDEFHATAKAELERINVDIPLNALVYDLSVADKQLVAISRALLNDARIVIMDEPTTALTHKEVESLFRVIADLKKAGIAILFVSHKLREVIDISQKITILRNGKKVAEGDVADFNETSITKHMTGRSISEDRFVYSGHSTDKPILSVKNLTRQGSFSDVNFEIRPGEILGITGLLGSGRTDLALSLFGEMPTDTGDIFIDGRKVGIRTIQDAVNAGIAYVPEDRLTEGLFLQQSIKRNIVASILHRLQTSLGLIDFKLIAQTVKTWVTQLNIATPSADVPAQTLSGGNQQRIVLARWLAAQSRVLMLNGPTVGVDVGSKEAIHVKLRELSVNGVGIIIMSDDLPEIVQNCNRVLFMHKGEVVKEFTGDFSDSDLLAQFDMVK